MEPTALGTWPRSPGLAARPTGLTLTPTTSPFWKKRPQAGPNVAHVGAGQFAHALVEHRGDGRLVDDVLRRDGVGPLHLDDAAGKRSRHGVFGPNDFLRGPAESGQEKAVGEEGDRDAGRESGRAGQKTRREMCEDMGAVP